MKKYFFGVLYSIIILPLLAVIAAYMFSTSIWLAFIVTSGLALAAQVVHMPEEIPGGYDNPEGNEVHPFWVMAYLAILVIISLVLVYTFPELVNKPGFKS